MPYDLLISIRAIYDNDEHVQFREKLSERIKQHDKDIERLCNIYYQGFIESVRELLEVRTQAKKLNVSSLGFLDNPADLVCFSEWGYYFR